jgi:hypothetical protein
VGNRARSFLTLFEARTLSFAPLLMNLDFNTNRWQSVRQNYARWWAGQLDRPLIHLTLKTRDPGRPPPELPAHVFASFYGLEVPPEAIADCWSYDLECCRFLGDAFPSVYPNFGPGVIAAFMGLELHNGNETVWFHQPETPELADLRFEFNPGNVWFQRVCDIYRAAAERFQGQAHLGMTDLGGNLDILSAFRPGERLLLDLYDVPEAVAPKLWRAHQLWWRYFEELNRIIQPAHAGYTAWTPLYSEEPYYMLQCDFSYMLSPAMFERFVKPELEASCQRLANPFYHLDGVGQLPHLDSLLEIHGLKGIQWVPGAGKPGVTEWPEVYRKIRAAGKRIQFFTTQDPLGWRSLDIVARQLGSAEGIMMYGEVPWHDEADARRMLERYGLE